jgi:hypothetical protein
MEYLIQTSEDLLATDDLKHIEAPKGIHRQLTFA